MERFKDFEYYFDRLSTAGVTGVLNGMSASTPVQQFTYTRELLMKYDILPKKVKVCNVDRVLNTAKSESMRFKGNEFFQNKAYIRALKCYTGSLMLAEHGSEAYGYVLANRSAVFFHINRYKHCLQDIRRALESKFPTKLVYKLYERAGNAERRLECGDAARKSYMECLKHLEKAALSEKIKNEIKTRVMDAIEKCEEGSAECNLIKKKTTFGELVGGKNKNIPALSAFLELKVSKTMGRGVYATCDINPGDIVLIEEPYIGASYPTVTYVCNYTGCLKLSLAVISCPKCLVTVYCDEYCMQMDEKNGHLYQCPIMYSIQQMPGIPKLNELVLKTFLKEYCQIGLNEYCSIVNNLTKNTIDLLTRGFVKGQYKSENFFTAYSLDGCESKHSKRILFFLNCVAAEILQYLILSGFYVPKSNITTIGVSFVHMLNVLDINAWKFSVVNCPSVPSKLNRNFRVTIACALYPSIGLFNHSCDPNVKQSGVLSDRINVLTAVQPISKGSQLFISYGVSFQGHSKEMRDSFFKLCAMFECQCQPCVENWPWGRFIPNRLSPLSLINFGLKETISLECSKFYEYLNKVRPQDSAHHLSYLYNFAKLLHNNVKRPYTLYEDCIGEISSGHVLTCNDDFEYSCVEDNWL